MLKGGGVLRLRIVPRDLRWEAKGQRQVSVVRSVFRVLGTQIQRFLLPFLPYRAFGSLTSKAIFVFGFCSGDMS